ncbi:MAG: DUF2157 domain-containing protein [Candidatus Omnitrophica bacterium]|nr:DUF2157 domain-containing protein [Candidatus Omnitrophota bacterium]
MNTKAVQWLYQELPDLVTKGVITEAAANNLRGHYGEVKTSDKKWFVIISCSVLGALLIGLGIILLFGHNWEQLSRQVRTILSLLPLMIAQVLAFWVVLKRSASQALKEGTATFLSLMVGASIALISQTYNIPNDTPAFILTWMLLIVPLTYFMEATIPAAIYVVGVSAWAGHFWNEPLKAFLFWPLLSVVIPHFIWSLKQKKYTVRSAILSLVMATGICVGAGFTLGRTFPGSWIVIYSSIITIFYLLGAWEFKGISTNWQRPFHILGGVGIFILMFMFTFRFPWESISHRYYYASNEISSWTAIPDHMLTFVLIGSAMLLFFQFAKRQDWMRTLFGALPFLALFGYAVGGSSPAFSMFLFNIFLLIISVYRLMTGIQSNNLGIINTGIFMLATLVLARFFDSEMSFVIKGLVFILIGVGFLATNVVILRRKGGAA